MILSPLESCCAHSNEVAKVHTAFLLMSVLKEDDYMQNGCKQVIHNIFTGTTWTENTFPNVNIMLFYLPCVQSWKTFIESEEANSTMVLNV